MVDGLGLAETTPGPLILVTQFVGFLAAFRDAAPFSPVFAGILGAAMTTWVTFAPSMLWIFAGAPFVERSARQPQLAGALAAITAAVVGVILNLDGLVRAACAVRPHRGAIERAAALVRVRSDWRSTLAAASLAMIAAVLVFRFHRGLIEIVAVMAALGIAVKFAVAG